MRCSLAWKEIVGGSVRAATKWSVSWAVSMATKTSSWVTYAETRWKSCPRGWLFIRMLPSTRFPALRCARIFSRVVLPACHRHPSLLKLKNAVKLREQVQQWTCSAGTHEASDLPRKHASIAVIQDSQAGPFVS